MAAVSYTPMEAIAWEVTDAEVPVLDKDDVANIEDDEDGGNRDYVTRITLGWWDNIKKSCRVNCSWRYSEHFKDAPLSDVMEDDYNGVVLRWVVNNKWGEDAWMCATREGVNRNAGGQYSNWVDWETFVRDEVKEGRLKEEVLKMVRDGGGETTTQETEQQ